MSVRLVLLVLLGGLAAVPISMASYDQQVVSESLFLQQGKPDPAIPAPLPDIQVPIALVPWWFE